MTVSIDPEKITGRWLAELRGHDWIKMKRPEKDAHKFVAREIRMGILKLSEAVVFGEPKGAGQ